MTESKDNIETNENIDPRFENLAGYVLGALDHAEQRSSVENHIEKFPDVQAEFEELSETVDLLALGVPPVSPPDHLKTNIMELARQESTPSQLQLLATAHGAMSRRSWWQRSFQSGYAVAAAAAALVIVVGGGMGYQNDQLSNDFNNLRVDLIAESTVVANLRSELSTTMMDSETKVASMKSEMDVMEDEFGATTEMVVHQEEVVSELAVANNALKQALRDQIWLTYVTSKEGYQVESWLADNTQQVTATKTAAYGLIAVRVVGNEAVFQAHGLDQPQSGFAYTVWLMGNGKPLPVAQFGVSEIGSATIAFIMPAPLQFYSSVMVTQERVNGLGSDPSGTMVIFAETN